MATKKKAAKPPAKKTTARRAPAPSRASKAPPPGWEPVAVPPMAPPPAPPPAPAPLDENTWAMSAHLAAFASFVVPFGNILGPLVVWLMKKENPFVSRHGKESLNFQISITLYELILVALIVVVVFTDFFGTATRPELSYGMPIGLALPVVLTVGVFSIVMVIRAALRANKGMEFRYPLSIRFVR
jgi:uncharacterized protein